MIDWVALVLLIAAGVINILIWYLRIWWTILVSIK
jgi:hypothetical protein